MAQSNVRKLGAGLKMTEVGRPGKMDGKGGKPESPKLTPVGMGDGGNMTPFELEELNGEGYMGARRRDGGDRA